MMNYGKNTAIIESAMIIADICAFARISSISRISSRISSIII